MTENSGGYAPPGKQPEQPGYGTPGQPPDQSGGYKPPDQSGGYKPPEQPPDQSGGYKPPPQTGDDKCPDPSGPYIRYQVAAEIATKKESLFTADATAVAAKHEKLAGAQQEYANAWADQKKKWADLACELKRIRDTLNNALDEAKRNHLEKCWAKLSAEATKATQPIDCTDMAGLDCKKLLDDVMKLEPDKLADALVNWRRQAEHAEQCAGQDDQKFDELADFPGKLAGEISGLSTRAGNIDDNLAKPGNDPQRSYVEYLALHDDFCKLWRKIISAAAYTCKLKYVFVHLLTTHQAWICLQVAIHGAEQRISLENAAKQAQAGTVIDRVLECALPTQADDTTKPPGDCPPEPGQGQEPKPGYGTPGQGQDPKPGYGTPGQQPPPGQYGPSQQQPPPGPTQSAGG